MQLNWFCAKGGKFNNVTEKAGVYIISTLQDSDNKYEVKYVGRTKNLKHRANEHWSDSQSNEKLKKHIDKGYTMKFNYAKVDRQSDREGIELYLYKLYKPIFNQDTPDATKEIRVNTPNVRKAL